MSNKRFQKKIKLKKDDIVVVVAGNDKSNKENRKEGKVLMVYPKKHKVLVEGVNIVSRHTRPNAQYPNGGIIKKEAPIDISNVMLKDPKTGDPTRIGRKVENGKIVRFAKKSGEILD